jgi:hypothetical protein
MVPSNALWPSHAPQQNSGSFRKEALECLSPLFAPTILAPSHISPSPSRSTRCAHAQDTHIRTSTPHTAVAVARFLGGVSVTPLLTLARPPHRDAPRARVRTGQQRRKTAADSGHPLCAAHARGVGVRRGRSASPAVRARRSKIIPGPMPGPDGAVPRDLSREGRAVRRFDAGRGSHPSQSRT